ncbi:indole-3-glycerol phosphate synthase TrpC [Magnetospira sp. QH-2]|uniref:indole-3-glycerol phosphate synthase TrpC n=1 Tax=Magnetospira sp. (strain QH-2) TaxID=1288970 RepID=UPI0003E81798|nr:indole-3-glycerol phosphate synthase TrpC [Magnetospira sp. QH-2]CCQ73962.1 Indole-3-glycerol-phosphate synthase (IGPS) [Magnetospira sp. QH-2]
MDNVLDKICADKRDHVARCKADRSLADVERAAKSAEPTRGFAEALTQAVAEGGHGLIAEIKKASPSKGLIRGDFDPETLAAAYEAGGASCLSVLTDQPYFQGHDDYLVAARSVVDLPVLRKDFMVDPYQVTEARSLGADCILLIMAALDDGLAKELESAAMDWGMDVLIEIHDGEELDRALALRSPLLGINNRNLKTLEVSLATTETLAPRVPTDRHLVCESGLFSAKDLHRMSKVGAHRFLIGESLMRQPDVAAATKAILAPIEDL